jgi:plastocyanin
MMTLMRRQGRLLFSLSICVGFFLLSCEGAVAGQGGLKGEVSINGVKVPNIVLYLLPENGIAPKPAPMEYTIAQEGLQFSPAFSVVTTGSTIFFENRDDNIHNVRSESPSNSFNIGSHLPKTVKSIVLKNSGLVSLKCKVHPEMNGLIFVSPTTLFSATDAAGTFEILNVPPGNYLLELWHQSFTRRELVGNVKKISIGAEMKTVSIDLTASGGLSQEMVSHNKQNWFVEMKAVARGLEEVLDKWEREKKRSALTKIMRTYSALYMESGLRNAIAKSFGEPRALNQEEQFNQIRKWIQGLKRGADVLPLEEQVSALLSELEKDVQAIKGH